MKRYGISLLAGICLILLAGVLPAHAQHFDYEEAYTIMQGTWSDSDTGKKYTFVWRSKNGQECNIVNENGYTDPRGNSLIYIDYKGITVKLQVTYYPDQGRYYARAFRKDNAGNDGVWFQCLAKE